MTMRPTITVALNSIPVFEFDSRECAYVPLEDIQIVRPSGDGLIDVVYTYSHDLPSGITVREIKSGETDINQLLIALGWQPGMSHNENLTVLSSSRRTQKGQGAHAMPPTPSRQLPQRGFA